MSAPSDISSEGMRQVTGSEEPAIKGNCIEREVSYISFAHSHFQDRCLSLKTGPSGYWIEKPLQSAERTGSADTQSALSRCAGICRARRPLRHHPQRAYCCPG